MTAAGQNEDELTFAQVLAQMKGVDLPKQTEPDAKDEEVPEDFPVQPARPLD
jgi:hypothetical protein